MQGISVLSLAEAQDQVDETLRLQDASAVADELFAVADLLDREPALRRALSDPSAPEQARAGLVDTVLGSQLSAETIQVLRIAVAKRWTNPQDLVEAVETLARRVVFSQAEQDGSLDEVEDELFRFGRIIDDNSHLATLLGDRSASSQRRQGLLDSLIADKVHPTTRQLLDRLLSAANRHSLDRSIERLCEQAAARHGRVIAHVRTAVTLTPDQEGRLASALGRIYRRDVAVHSEVEPDLLGGLSIQVGDDVIDGTVLRSLDEAARGLIG